MAFESVWVGDGVLCCSDSGEGEEVDAEDSAIPFVDAVSVLVI